MTRPIVLVGVFNCHQWVIIVVVSHLDAIILALVGCPSVASGGVKPMLFLPREKGQGLVEYALILVLVAIVVIAILLLLGPVIGNIFSNIVNAI